MPRPGLSQGSLVSVMAQVLFHLHWLPIGYGIRFKISLLKFKYLHGLAPQCLIDLQSIAKSPRYNFRDHRAPFNC